MKTTGFIVLLVIGALSVNGRVLKRQRKRVLPKTSPARSCQRTVLELPSSKSLLESAFNCLGSGCPDPCGCSNTCGCPDPYICPSPCGCPDIFSPVICSCQDAYGCPSYCDCPDNYGCPRNRGCQNIFLEELSCGCNYDSFTDYGILDAINYERIPTRLPKPLASIDTGIPVAATLCRDVTSCQCQNPLPYQILDPPCSCRTYEYFNPANIPSPVMKMPLEIIQPVFVEAPLSVVQPLNCGCQPVKACCQRQKCGCQLSALDIPCSCQLPGLGTSCCTLAALDIPCGCQLPALNLPCGCQLTGLDCGCQFQAYNSQCCQLPISSCSCQLPVPNVPYVYQLASSDVPCGCQLSVLDVPCGCQLPNCGCQLPNCGCQLPSCGCQLPNCGCQLPSCGCQVTSCGCQSVPLPEIGCAKYLRQVTLQPPFVI